MVSAPPKEQPITFVLGMARSGTTFLADLLHDEFDHGMGPESSFVPTYANRLWRYGDIRERTHLERLAVEISRCEALEIARREYPPNRRFDVTPEMILAHVQAPEYASVVRAVFECVASLQGKSRLGSKLPAYWRHMSLLIRLFPNQSRFIWLVRDGRDVAMSLMKQPWGERSVYSAARQWVRSLDRMEHWRGRLGDRLLVVRYEDLLERPFETLTAMSGFLSAQMPDDRIVSIADRIRASSLAKNFQKWRLGLTPDELRQFEAIGGRWLERLAYHRTHADPRVSLAEHLRFSAEEIYRRVLRLVP